LVLVVDTTTQRLELLLHVGQYLSGWAPSAAPAPLTPSAGAAARAALAAQLDVGAGYLTAGDWRPFFPPALLEQAPRDGFALLPHDSVAALLRLLSFVSQRLLGADTRGGALPWQEAMQVFTLGDLARFLDSCFAQLPQHVYLVLRHFRPDLIASMTPVAS
jgi:hypothetical protein